MAELDFSLWEYLFKKKKPKTFPFCLLSVSCPFSALHFSCLNSFEFSVRKGKIHFIAGTRKCFQGASNHKLMSMMERLPSEILKRVLWKGQTRWSQHSFVTFKTTDELLVPLKLITKLPLTSLGLGFYPRILRKLKFQCLTLLYLLLMHIWPPTPYSHSYRVHKINTLNWSNQT